MPPSATLCQGVPNSQEPDKRRLACPVDTWHVVAHDDTKGHGMPLSEEDISQGLMGKREACAFLGCSLRTLNRMIDSGELEAFRLREGGSLRITRAACVEALNRTSTVARRRGRPRKGAA